jgi:hypothetical protein
MPVLALLSFVTAFCAAAPPGLIAFAAMFWIY